MPTDVLVFIFYMLFSHHFPNNHLTCVCHLFPSLIHDMTPGFGLASSEHFVGAHLSRCPAMTSWNYAPHGCTQHARAACTHCHEWIPPWLWFMTQLRAMVEPAVALEGSPPCPPERKAMLRLATQRSLDATVAVWKHRMEALQMLNLRNFLEGSFHRCTYRRTLIHRHMHVRNFKNMQNTLYKQTVHECKKMTAWI